MGMVELKGNCAPHVECFLSEVVSWARSRGDIANIALAGSQAHGTARPDSDIDLVLLVKDKEVLTEDRSWLSLLGTVERVAVKQFGVLTSVIAWFKEIGEVEFGIAWPSWADIPVDAGTRQVVTDGIRILDDPDGRLRELVKAVRAKVSP